MKNGSINTVLRASKTGFRTSQVLQHSSSRDTEIVSSTSCPVISQISTITEWVQREEMTTFFDSIPTTLHVSHFYLFDLEEFVSLSDCSSMNVWLCLLIVLIMPLDCSDYAFGLLWLCILIVLIVLIMLLIVSIVPFGSYGHAFWLLWLCHWLFW